ncbi:MAG: MmcB family DNA repair protein [Alphaproteobacteria bacterium]|nr:MmcB family DNA repair protein [Alphaproteobacteria bacterium]
MRDARPIPSSDADLPVEPAQALARGVARLFADLGQTALFEFSLRNRRRADVTALAADGLFTIAEIKTSVADFRADQKWPDYLPFCDFFYFAVPTDFPTALIPDECGLIVADAYGGAIVREAPEVRMNATRRRALALRYGRTAARRLMQHTDPGGGY